MPVYSLGRAMLANYARKLCLQTVIFLAIKLPDDNIDGERVSNAYKKASTEHQANPQKGAKH